MAGMGNGDGGHGSLSPEKLKKAKSPQNAMQDSSITVTHVLIALNETEVERNNRIRKLFNSFDATRKGYVDVADIEKGLKSRSIPSLYTYAKDLLNLCDANHDGRVDFGEFRQYMDDKELELYRLFKEIDVSCDGCIVPQELRDALQRAGIQLSKKELDRFVERIDKDHNGMITFEEWRDFLLLYPRTATLTNVYRYWEKVCLVDIGEQAVIPEGVSRQLNATKYFIAGGVAGALSRTATAPLDRLKVLLQVESSPGKQRLHARPYVSKIYKDSGIVGFFRGNGLNVARVAPESAIKFYAYEMIKDMITKSDSEGHKEDIGAGGRLFAGGAAGAVAQTAIYPLEVVKVRLQTYVGSGWRPPTIMKLSKGIMQHEGPRAFYRGLLPSVLGIVPYAGIDVATYEYLTNSSRQFLPADQEPGPVVQLCCGMVSGALGATCVYPLQLVRTRLQAQQRTSSFYYKGMVDTFQRVWRDEGFLAFYKGLVPSLLKVIPSASITYIAYEKMKKHLSL